jgi:hypothetical protein
LVEEDEGLTGRHGSPVVVASGGVGARIVRQAALACPVEVAERPLGGELRVDFRRRHHRSQEQHGAKAHRMRASTSEMMHDSG